MNTQMKTFDRWSDLTSYVSKNLKINLYSGVGISNRKSGVSILRSVDDTYYYKDDLTDPENIDYTLYGLYGNQNKDELKFNKVLLSGNRDIYVYRVFKENKKAKWIWYGKYEIESIFTDINPDKNFVDRVVYILRLKRVSKDF